MVQARGEAEAARGEEPHEPGRDPPPEREIQAGGCGVQRGVEAAAGRRDHHHEPAQIGGDPRVTTPPRRHATTPRRDEHHGISPPDLPPDIRLYPSTGAPTPPRGKPIPRGDLDAPLDPYRLLYMVCKE